MENIKRITAKEAHADADKVNQKRLADEQETVYNAILEAKKSGEYSTSVDFFISDELRTQLVEDGFYVKRIQGDGYKQDTETIIKY